MGKTFPSNKHKITVLVPGQGLNPKFGRKRVTYQFTLSQKNRKYEINCLILIAF